MRRNQQARLDTAVDAHVLTLLSGPPRCGKTWLAREAMPDAARVSLDDAAAARAVLNDLDELVEKSPEGLVIDDVPRAGRALDVVLDWRARGGDGKVLCVVNGAVEGPLLGRVRALPSAAALSLSPLSLAEVAEATGRMPAPDELMFAGGLPANWLENTDRALENELVVTDYVEGTAWAGRRPSKSGPAGLLRSVMAHYGAVDGTLLQPGEIAKAVPVAYRSTVRWSDALVDDGVLSLVEAWQGDDEKTTKKPRPFFYDPAVLCTLLGLRSERDLAVSPARGLVWRNLVANECLKAAAMRRGTCRRRYWRDRNAVGVLVALDLGHAGRILVDATDKPGPFLEQHFQGLSRAGAETGTPVGRRILVHTGPETRETSWGLAASVWDLEGLVH